MCGIVGILARNAAVAPDILERATQSLSHRGPDDSGSMIVRETISESIEVGLGNRRLAILDLSPLGHQPMQDPESGNWIVYNGEVYNFREIRSRLERVGVQFRSQSDTEVLLKAYAQWGDSFLHELRGMFALAIWDARRHRMFIARDPMGIKPLYYCSAGPYFLFASEIRTLLGTGLVPKRLDRAGLLNYLSFGSLYDPITLIEGISALRPGHSLVWEKGTVRETMYWDLVPEERSAKGASAPFSEPSSNRKTREEHLGALLEESVRMRMVSDVPVGLFLSGGIDSSALAGILTRGGAHLNTFSLAFREQNYSEAEYSRMVAARFGTEHCEITVSQTDALDAIPGFGDAMDQPTIDGLNTYLIARKTREAGIKVALSGLGGDEMFAGYSSFRTVPQMERFAGMWKNIPAAARRVSAAAFMGFAPNSDQNRKLAALIGGNGDLVHPYFLSRMLFMPSQREALLAGNDVPITERAASELQENLRRTEGMDSINRISYLESRCYMLNTLLRDSDVMSMAHGLEVRVPLIDHRLAQELMALPGEWKRRDGVPKPLLVDAMRGLLPDEIVHRGKRGFTLPFEHWLRDELRGEVETVLVNIGDGPLGPVVDRKAVQKVWGDFMQGETSWSRPWALYILGRWCERHSVAA